jgi:DNA topoisomerase-2
VREVIAVYPEKRVESTDIPLDVMNIPEEDILQELTAREYDLGEGSFNYLLTMHIRTFTKEKVEALRNEIEKKQIDLSSIRDISPGDMWRKELDNFVKEYAKFVKGLGKQPKKGKK